MQRICNLDTLHRTLSRNPNAVTIFCLTSLGRGWRMEICPVRLSLAPYIVDVCNSLSETTRKNFKTIWDLTRENNQVMYNMSWRDDQRKNGVNNVDMSSLRVPYKMSRTKTNTQNNTKTRRTPKHNRQLEKNYFLCFSHCCDCYFLLVLTTTTVRYM